MTISNELREQVDKAFDFRGHVTLTLDDGSSVEGYLYNRDFERGYLDVFVKNSDERRRLELSRLRAVALTGEDCAAGKSYDDYMKKKAAEKKA
jgi:hypothetical protein